MAAVVANGRQAKQARKLAMIKQELVKTEETYVAALRTLVREFMGPLAGPAGPSDSPPRVVERARAAATRRYGAGGIFQGLDGREILGLNECLLADLRASVQTHDGRIAPVFLKYAPMMSMYCTYCAAHQDILERMEMARDSADINGFLCDVERRCNVTLQSLLIQPVQRLPRYKLLLQEIVKNTPAGSRRDRVTDALRAVAEKATQVNDQLRAFEDRKKVFSLSRRIAGCPSLIGPSRKYVRGGVLKKISRTRSSHAYHFFLFSDGTLVYATASAGAAGAGAGGVSDKARFTFRRKITVLGVKRKPRSARFRLTGTPKSISVCALSIEDANAWEEALMACFSGLIAGPQWNQGGRLLTPSSAAEALAAVAAARNPESKVASQPVAVRRASSSYSNGPVPAWNLAARSRVASKHRN